MTRKQLFAVCAAFLLALLLAPLRGTAAPKIVEEFFPSGEISAPKAPFLRYSGRKDDGDSIQMRYNVPKDVLALAGAYNRWGDANHGREGFIDRFGVEEYRLYLQTDARIDDGPWQYSEEWDDPDWPGFTEPHPLAFHCVEGLANNPGKAYDNIEVSWLTYLEKGKLGFLAPIVTPFRSDGGTNYHYDLERHTLTVRCRLVLEYSKDGDEMQRIFSPWSPTTSIGLDGTQKELDASDVEATPASDPAPAPEPEPASESVPAPESASALPGSSEAPAAAENEKPGSAEGVAAAFTASEWARSELEEAAALGLIPDILKGADLTEPITRAEFAAVSVKCYEALTEMKAEPYTPNPFTDTTDVEVLKAYNIDVTNGTSPTAFSPEALLNREQAATMLTRLYKKIAIAGWTLETDGNYAGTFRGMFETPMPFADDRNISGWAKDSVYFMKAKGVIDGVGGNIFAPRATTDAEEATGYAQATREQAILIAKRMVKNLG
ncbi:MAG: S-layer homology domain-containing protein [Schwartzia sp.]|nr:S-layer homology domain-containing protein [Schwartzia sp. (in: firmicutes)]